MPQIDIERALKALDGNQELLKDLARMFVEDAPILLAKIKVALSNNQLMQAREAAHGLKGLIATFYAKKGVEMAQRIEDAVETRELGLVYGDAFSRLEDFVDSLKAEFVANGWIDCLCT